MSEKKMIVLDKCFDSEQYKTWCKTEFGCNIDSKYEFYYQTVIQKIKNDFEDGKFWQEFLKNYKEYDDEYFMSKGVHLLNTNDPILICTKPLESLLIKSYRANYLNNLNFPSPPNGGWMKPDNWFNKSNDIIRTTIIVKYLDGVEFIINKLNGIAETLNYESDSVFEAREEGYYAAHYVTKIEFSIPDFNFAPLLKAINIEIQVTTQLQEVIKTLLHKYYEENRKKIQPINYKWQWDHKSDEFIPNYLGHIVHYIEGMIIEIRDKQNEK